MMKLADYFTERDMAMCSLAKQVGVDYGVGYRAASQQPVRYG